MTRRLAPGLYERIVTARLAEELAALSDAVSIEREGLDPEESHLVLARHLHPILSKALRLLPGEPAEKLQAQIVLCNRVLEVLGAAAVDCGLDVKDAVAAAAEELRAIYSTEATATGAPVRPGIPLSATALLVNARCQGSAHLMGSQLGKTDVLSGRSTTRRSALCRVASGSAKLMW